MERSRGDAAEEPSSLARLRAFFSAFFEMGAAVVPPAAVRFGAAGCFVLCRFGATVLKQTGFR